jgi:hypothetical protein
MLTEESVISQIAVDETGVLSVRRSLYVLRDGVRISSTFHRTTYEPGASLDGEASIVKAIAGLVWTPAVIDTATKRRAEAIAALTALGLPPPAAPPAPTEGVPQ